MSRTCRSALDDEARERASECEECGVSARVQEVVETEGRYLCPGCALDDPFASELCSCCNKPAKRGECIEYFTATGPGVCWTCLPRVYAVSLAVVAAQRFVPRKCGVVVETTGVEIREAV